MIISFPTVRFRSSCGLRGYVFLWLLALATALGTTTAAYALDEAELLPEEEAFAFSAELLPDQRLAVRWDIADGYYMYRDKMGFEVVGGNTLAGPLSLPEGKPKDDAIFGEVDVYTGEFVMHLPLAGDSAEFILLVQGQGCNDPVGVCYPPMQHEIRFNSAISGAISPGKQSSPGLPGSLATGADLFPAGSGFSAVPGLTSQDDPAGLAKPGETAPTASMASPNPVAGAFEQTDFLAVDQAFNLTIVQSGTESLLAHFEIADGYYLYRDKIGFRSSGSAGIKNIELPSGEPKDDPYFGPSRIFTESFDIPISLTKLSTDGGPLSVLASYQGCAVDGICYAPVSREFKLELMSPASAASAATGSVATEPARTLPGILLGAFFAGLLLTFTPCVLPMIPILSSVISGQGEGLTKSRGVLLASAYVLGTAVTYAIMGAIAGATGEQLQAYFQNAWAVGALITVLVIMALSMFGLFQIQVPAAIQGRLQTGSRKLTGSLPLVFLLGLVSALIIGACVSPVLISFLGLAMSRADPVLGAWMMFAMAIGMGLPLLALGFGAGHLLPRAGPWMDTIKHILGIMLIAVAIYLLGIFPQVPILLVWGAFLIIVSSYIGPGRSGDNTTDGWQKLGRGLAIIFLVWGIAALVGGLAGQRDLLQPIPGQLLQAPGNNDNHVDNKVEQPLFARLQEPEDLDVQFALASSSGKQVMIDFYADWCVDCIRMEETTFRDPRVRTVLEQNYLALQVDVTNPNDPGTRAIKRELGVFGPPAVLFFDSNRTSLAEQDFYGYKNPDEFLALIDD